MPFMK